MDAPGVDLIFCGVFQNLSGVPRAQTRIKDASPLELFIQHLDQLYPGIFQAVVPEPASRKVSPDVLLIVNGMPVRVLEDSITVQNGDQIIFMLMIAGG